MVPLLPVTHRKPTDKGFPFLPEWPVPNRLQNLLKAWEALEGFPRSRIWGGVVGQVLQEFQIIYPFGLQTSSEGGRPIPARKLGIRGP